MSLSRKTSYPAVSVLVSVGQHPVSRRTRRAASDARAVELGLTLNPGPEVLHAGNPDQEALRSYAGMGLKSLRVIRQDEADDVVDNLVHYLAGHMPEVVLTGMRAENGESSGMLPYLLAERLGCPIISGITDILHIREGYAEVQQALPRGQRRLLRVAVPFVATVDMAAQAPRQSAYGPGRRAQIDIDDDYEGERDAIRQAWQETPAKSRPKRLKVTQAKTAAERLKAAVVKSEAAEAGRVIQDQPAEVMVQAIFEVLLDEGVFRSGSAQ